MSPKDLITLCLSGMAMVIALYGILERGLANRRALRIRLTELIDSLAQIDTNEPVYAQDLSKSTEMKTALSNANATRRALLAAQAVDILSRYRRRITIPEYVVLASALHGTSDTAGERGVLAQAVADLSKENPFQQAAAWRTWAQFSFQQDDFETGRRAVRRSLDAMSPIDDVSKIDRLWTLMMWFDFELARGTHEGSPLHAVLEKAEALLLTVKNDETREDAGKRVRAAREFLDGTPI